MLSAVCSPRREPLPGLFLNKLGLAVATFSVFSSLMVDKSIKREKMFPINPQPKAFVLKLEHPLLIFLGYTESSETHPQGSFPDLENKRGLQQMGLASSLWCKTSAFSQRDFRWKADAPGGLLTPQGRSWLGCSTAWGQSLAPGLPPASHQGRPWEALQWGTQPECLTPGFALGPGPAH